jgi:hypothetical protein
LGAEPQPEDSDQQRERKAKTKIEFAAQRFLDPDFDPKTTMGDALIELFPMSSFGTIIAAYGAIFPDDNARKIITDRGIRSLSAIRNVLVHNGGKADKDFPRLMKSDPRFSHIKQEEFVDLDGPKSAQLLESARTQGLRLIEYVDGWCNRVAPQSSGASTAPMSRISSEASTTAAPDVQPPTSTPGNAAAC